MGEAGTNSKKVKTDLNFKTEVIKIDFYYHSKP
jgi:hypothetical protein